MALLPAGDGWRPEPAGGWTDKHSVEDEQLHKAVRMARDNGSHLSHEFSGITDEPVLVQRSRDGAYLDERLFYEWVTFMKGYWRVDDLAWCDNPREAIGQEF